MLTYICWVSNMKHRLNYGKEDPNYGLLDKIFKIIGSRKSRRIIASKGVKNIDMMVLSIKIVFMAIFFDLTVEFVVNELKRDKKLRKFFEYWMKFQKLFKSRNFCQDFRLIHTLKS